MSGLAEPHAGFLVDRYVEEHRAADLRARAQRLPQLTLDERETIDLELIATGAASPLRGFLGGRDYRSVLDRLTLVDGTPWPVPFTLAVTVSQMASVLRERAAALRDREGRLRGVIDASDMFVRNPRDEAVALYGTDDAAHPGVAYLLARPTGLLGGEITVLQAPKLEGALRACVPREARALARRGRWSGLAGLGTAEGAGCLEPLGSSRPALLSIPRVAIRHSPGRDALLQALVLKNHGAREVFLEYDRSDWLDVAQRFAPEDLGVTPIWMIPVPRPGPRRREGARF
jgi:sulfate adenylyltransferase